MREPPPPVFEFPRRGLGCDQVPSASRFQTLPWPSAPIAPLGEHPVRWLRAFTANHPWMGWFCLGPRRCFSPCHCSDLHSPATPRGFRSPASSWVPDPFRSGLGSPGIDRVFVRFLLFLVWSDCHVLGGGNGGGAGWIPAIAGYPRATVPQPGVLVSS